MTSQLRNGTIQGTRYCTPGIGDWALYSMSTSFIILKHAKRKKIIRLITFWFSKSKPLGFVMNPHNSPLPLLISCLTARQENSGLTQLAERCANRAKRLVHGRIGWPHIVSLDFSSSCQATVERKIEGQIWGREQSGSVRYTVTKANIAPYSSAIPLIGHPETVAFVPF